MKRWNNNNKNSPTSLGIGRSRRKKTVNIVEPNIRNRHIVSHSEPRSISIITSALSGMTGGGMLLSFLGPGGAIAGGIVGAVITGYSEFVNQRINSEKQTETNTVEKAFTEKSY